MVRSLQGIAPILEEVAKEYDGKLQIAKMDVDSNQAVPAKFGIRGIPTLILFKNGVAAAQKVGAWQRPADLFHRQQYLTDEFRLHRYVVPATPRPRRR
jgi:thiol-disulfide isomerase/thioredoxin